MYFTFLIIILKNKQKKNLNNFYEYIRLMWGTNKNNILLKIYLLVLIAYYGSSSHLIPAFLPSPSETEISKGGVRQEREFQPTHSDDTAVLLRYLRLVM